MLGFCRGDLTLSGVTPESGVSAGYGVTGVVMSIGGPKTLAFSITKRDMRGAGMLSVGAKTIPTVVVLVSHEAITLREPTYHCERSSCLYPRYLQFRAGMCSEYPVTLGLPVVICSQGH